MTVEPLQKSGFNVVTSKLGKEPWQTGLSVCSTAVRRSRYSASHQQLFRLVYNIVHSLYEYNSLLVEITSQISLIPK